MKTQIVMKLKKSNGDKTQLKLWQNTKNSNCDKTQIVTKLKIERKKISTQNVKRFKLWQNLRTQILTKLKNSNYDKTQKLKLWQN